MSQDFSRRHYIYRKILEVIPLREISGILPAVQYDECVDWNIEQYKDKLEHGCWKYYSWSCQSDVGGWCLIHIDEAGVQHLVLVSDWLMRETNTYCGNIILQNEPKNTSREEIIKEQRYAYGFKDSKKYV